MRKLHHSTVRAGPGQAQPLGEVARQVNGENELWLAIALTSAAAQALLSCATCPALA